MPYTWEQIQQILAAEISGEEPKPMMSKRTLFGIPSTIEVMMEDAAREATRKRAEQLAEEEKEEEEREREREAEGGEPGRTQGGAPCGPATREGNIRAETRGQGAGQSRDAEG